MCTPRSERSESGILIVKEYVTIGLLGASTTTQDAEGAILTSAPFEHITREDIEKAVSKFQGSIKQIPPM